jgi:hypothetical protein
VGNFKLGRILVTAGVAHEIAQDDINAAVRRHASGDWGDDLSAEDREANDRALRDGDRLLSAYVIGDTKIWIITEGDRSATTVLLPEEY